MGQAKQRKKMMGDQYGKAPNPWQKRVYGTLDLLTGEFVPHDIRGVLDGGWKPTPEEAYSESGINHPVWEGNEFKSVPYLEKGIIRFEQFYRPLEP